jgi:hypothetical protein
MTDRIDTLPPKLHVPDNGPSPWHAGEIRMQQTLGVDAHMDKVGRKVLRNHLIEQHRLFYPQLPFVVLGTVDPDGNPWATLRAGKPGFLFATDPHHLSVRLPRDANDPADPGMNNGEAIGLLGIELRTRRRNRLNGTINRTNETSFDITVGHSFGNCPKYIHPRDLEFATADDDRNTLPVERGTQLSDTARNLIRQSDTFFIASYTDQTGSDRGREIDVSHRGGPVGFVQIDPNGSLLIPDYSGNRFFNTLGNLVMTPLAGLAFVDFATGDVLQLTGTAEIILGGSLVSQFDGAERLLTVTPTQWVYRPGAFPMRMMSANGG